MDITYEDFINNILNSRGRNGIPTSEYYEKHHIIPKCCGGDNSIDNLIDLFAEEHYIAHKLLAEENPDNDKLQYAWWQMCVAIVYGRNYRVSAEDYAEAKKRQSKIRSEYMTGRYVSDETKKKQSEARKGIVYSDKYRENISKHHANVSGKNNPQYGKPAINRKSVYCPELNMTFSSMNDAALYVGLKSYASISACCVGRLKSAGKHPDTGQPLHWFVNNIN